MAWLYSEPKTLGMIFKRHMPREFWPNIVQGDDQLLVTRPFNKNNEASDSTDEVSTSSFQPYRPSIFLGSYYSAIDSGSFDIADAADQLFDDLRAYLSDPEDTIPFKKYTRILFIGHSMGGIIARRIVTKFWPYFSAKSVGVILIASPTDGSAYADLLYPAIAYLRHSQAKQLRRKEPLLDEIHKDFEPLVLCRRIFIAEAYEHKFYVHCKAFPLMRQVVERCSAVNYTDSPTRLHGTHHANCVQPRNASDQIHAFLQRRWAEFMNFEFNTDATADTDLIRKCGSVDKHGKPQSAETRVQSVWHYVVAAAITVTLVLAIMVASVSYRSQIPPQGNDLAQPWRKLVFNKGWEVLSIVGTTVHYYLDPGIVVVDAKRSHGGVSETNYQLTIVNLLNSRGFANVHTMSFISRKQLKNELKNPGVKPLVILHWHTYRDAFERDSRHELSYPEILKSERDFLRDMEDILYASADLQVILISKSPAVQTQVRDAITALKKEEVSITSEDRLITTHYPVAGLTTDHKDQLLNEIHKALARWVKLKLN